MVFTVAGWVGSIQRSAVTSPPPNSRYTRRPSFVQLASPSVPARVVSRATCAVETVYRYNSGVPSRVETKETKAPSALHAGSTSAALVPLSSVGWPPSESSQMSALPEAVLMNARRLPSGAQVGDESTLPSYPKLGAAAAAPVAVPEAVHSLAMPLPS